MVKFHVLHRCFITAVNRNWYQFQFIFSMASVEKSTLSEGDKMVMTRREIHPVDVHTCKLDI